MTFIASARASCASLDIAPCDMAAPTKRRMMNSAGSTSSTGYRSPVGELEQVAHQRRRPVVDPVEVYLPVGRVARTCRPPRRQDHRRAGDVEHAAAAVLVEPA